MTRLNFYSQQKLTNFHMSGYALESLIQRVVHAVSLITILFSLQLLVLI